MKKLIKLAAMAAAPAALMTTAAPATAGTDEYLGEVMLVGFNFCPRGSAEAAGQLIAISSNSALFSLYGTTFGGDGRTTFALPDLRGRSPVGYGTGLGLSPIQWGERGGTEQVTLTIANMPTHSHSAELRGENSVLANSKNPNGGTLALASENIYSNSNPPLATVKLAAGSVFINNAGGGQSFSIRNPFLGMRYCVATQGVFPSRS